MPSRVPTLVRQTRFPWKLAQSRREGKSAEEEDLSRCVIIVVLFFMRNALRIDSFGGCILQITQLVGFGVKERILMLREGKCVMGGVPLNLNNTLSLRSYFTHTHLLTLLSYLLPLSPPCYISSTQIYYQQSNETIISDYLSCLSKTRRNTTTVSYC